LKELDRNVGETEVDQTDADQTDANPGTDYKDICWQDGRRIVNKFACRKKMTIDISLIFCHDILAMILFRILTKSKGVHVLVL
jgi:hypothetical protein